MHVFVSGATGFVGTNLVPRLVAKGHSVVAWVRDTERARAALGPGVELVAAGDTDALVASMDRADAVVNLAGEPVAGGRWTAARKARIRSSRVDLTETLVDAMLTAERPPGTFVSASAVGYYGDAGDDPVSEDAEPGTDFLASLCLDWETAAMRAEATSRVVRLRIGLVLGREGGALGVMEPLFRAGLGGRLGSGEQYMPWIHVDDLVGLVLFAIENPSVRGAVNATAPHPVRNSEFTRAFASALGRPAFLPAPGFALRAALGEASDMLLSGQNAVPGAATRAGYRFSHETLEGALADLYPRRER